MRSSDRGGNDSPQIRIGNDAGTRSDSTAGDNWETLKDLFERALDCSSPQERSDFLAASCASDAALRAELESLLAEHRRMNAAFLEWAPALELRAEGNFPREGTFVGAYRLERQLGRGGMGTVFLASRADGAYQKQVAIKLISAAGVSRELVMRFLAERQILARLDHPNIARLVDGGATAAGEPYLVMDYVDGIPIDRYCRERSPELEQKLELFEQVCAAVSYAHENLVVHRDIKPGNILVTADGTPKLLDFGIAKLLRPDTSDSECRPTLSMLGTPEYASPEQVRGLAITKATDVYSLGVLLYELLTGRSPYQLASRAAHEMARVICEDDPPPPSSALSHSTGRRAPSAEEELPSGQDRKRRKRLRGDLDNIVMMALRKEPEQRYQTVAELTADLRRHAQGVPVHARGRAPGYRLLKFARRRRAAIGAGALAAVSLVATVEAVRLSPGFIPNRLHFRNRDWLLMAAFQNRTGDKLLDGTLETALQLELSRSAYVNLAPPQRMADTLKLMRLAPDAPLTEDLARQAAIRDGAIKGVLAGRIDKVGAKYLVSVRVVEPVSGATAVAFDRKASQEELLDAVGRISRDVREALGERTIAAMPPGSSLERATTPSLPALRAFSAGMQAVNAYQWRPAAQLMEEALREDSSFALAHIYAFHSYSNIGANELAKPHGEAAFRLASSVTERERLFILGSYYQRLAQDYPRALEDYEALVKLYPDDAWGVTNLLAVYASLGKTSDIEFGQLLERLVGLRQKTIASDLYRVWRYYAYRRRDPAKAKHFQEELLRIRTKAFINPVSLANMNVELDLASMADSWWRGDVQAAAGELSRLTAQDMTGKHPLYVLGIAMVNSKIGRNRTAQKLCESLTSPGVRSECLLRLAFMRADTKPVQALMNEIKVGGRTGALMDSDVPLAAWFGEFALAKQWKGGPDHQMLVNGLILETQGAPQAAIDQFSKWNPHLETGATNVQIWYRMEMARALEQQGKLEEAIAQLNQETDPQFVDFSFGWPWPRGRLQLAELYRKAGHSADAQRVEYEVRHYLSEGDRDNPILLRLNSPAAH